MQLAVYGGSYNPPHLGHRRAAESAQRALKFDKLYIMPVADPPHKEIPRDSPDADARYSMCKSAFSGMEGVEVSDLELKRGKKSYTLETLLQLHTSEPTAALFLLMGTDMLLSLEQWYHFQEILALCTIGVFVRDAQETEELCNFVTFLREHYQANIIYIPNDPLPISSTDVREALRRRAGTELVMPAVYEEIIRRRYYGAQPNFAWLREKAYAYLNPKRIPHVQGTEQEAVSLAKRWGFDEDLAAEAAILHDITKKLSMEEQLRLCEKYDIINDAVENASTKLLHAKTGAAFSRDVFGVSEAVYGAIRWHTTARPGMTLFEKIIYMADYIEPHRDFENVDKLRKLAYEDLDAAMILGLEMSLADIRSYGVEPHEMTVKALEWFRSVKRA